MSGGTRRSLNPSFPSTEWLAATTARGASPAFAEARTALDARVEAYHAVLPDLPSRQAGYYHDFFCPDHAVQLLFNPRDGRQHACPVDGRVFSGEPFDAAWGWSVNDTLSDAVLRAAVRRALGHAADRAPADANLIRRVVIGYAERYRTFPEAPQGQPGPYRGIACWTALDESVWIIRIAWAIALSRAAFSPQEEELLREGLLQPALEHLLAVRYQQIQNVGNWDRAAILTLGYLLDDERVIGQALDEKFGIRDQLQRGVTSDGLWWELSPSYHFYVLAAVAWTMRALRAGGRSFDQEETVQRMFAAPLDLAFPDLSLPATNDSWYHIGLAGEVGHGIPDADGFYEMAFGWFGDPSSAWVTSQNRLAGRPRTAFEALLDGAPEVPTVDRAVPRSRHFADSGLAMLRAGEGSATIAVLLKASPDDGDAHGHADQLGVAIFGGGTRVTIDPGTSGYGISLNDTWYRQSAAHSTVLIDSRSQPPGQARITRFEEVDGSVIVEAEISWPPEDQWPAVVGRARAIAGPDPDPHPGYAGIRMHRRLELRAGSLQERFTVEAPTERVIDWIIHLPWGTEPVEQGSVEAPDALRGPCGYEHLSAVRRLSAGEVALRAVLARGVVVVTIDSDDAASSVAERRFLASAPGNPAAERHAVLVRRQTGTRATFATRMTWKPV